MAMNRTLGMEAQKMQGYVQEQIERRERRGIVFSDEIKEAIFDYALLMKQYKSPSRAGETSRRQGR